MAEAAVADRVASGRGTTIDRQSLAHLAIGTLVTLDLAAARDRYERVFGLECIDYAPGMMMVRDRRAKYLMERGEDFFLLHVTEVAQIDHPQTRDNHWGFSIRDRDEVIRIRKELKERQSEFGIKQVLPVTPMHGSTGFYFTDTDDNWWEVEFRQGVTNDLLFSHGDWDAEGRDDFPVIDPPLPIAESACEIMGSDAFMTHGTVSVADCDAGRAFYEDVLGLRTVHHAKPANCFAGGGDFATVGVGIRGVQDQGPENRFVLLVDSDDALDALHDKVELAAADHGLKHVSPIGASVFGGRSFLLRTADQIWFEILAQPKQYFADLFAAAA